ncbi:putative Fe-containing alcohol dehydrogenase [Mycena leptocephala]|nr:putative Fe-containing alcohol dehydrogenase [Mycena leptocephala]
MFLQPGGVVHIRLLNNCYVSYGLPFTEACAKHAEDTFHAKRVLILSSGTLARSSSALADLQAALGPKVALVKTGLRAHTYFNEILTIAEESRVLGLTDAAKMIVLVLANDVTNSTDLLKLPTIAAVTTASPAKKPTVPVICISTTLSGGEFTSACGATDDRDNQKHQFGYGHSSPHHHLRLFLESGIRVVDHCIEALCSEHCNEATEMYAKASLSRLVPGLLRSKVDAEAKADIEARFLCQMASIDAIASVALVYTPVGGSHAIGHVLGPFGVVHGATSGIILPAVCKYNARHSADAASHQEGAKAILWAVPEMRKLAESKGLVEGVADLGDLLDVLVRAQGMARTLAEVGVGRDKFEKLAEYGIGDPFAKTNPVPITEATQVMEILEMVAE